MVLQALQSGLVDTVELVGQEEVDTRGFGPEREVALDVELDSAGKIREPAWLAVAALQKSLEGLRGSQRRDSGLEVVEQPVVNVGQHLHRLKLTEAACLKPGFSPDVNALSVRLRQDHVAIDNDWWGKVTGLAAKGGAARNELLEILLQVEADVLVLDTGMLQH
jgi:hypothetical protein